VWAERFPPAVLAFGLLPAMGAERFPPAVLAMKLLPAVAAYARPATFLAIILLSAMWAERFSAAAVLAFGLLPAMGAE
jgi:hypothetical protein